MTETTEQEKMKVVYYSTNKFPFVPILVPESMAEIGETYPLTTKAPDPSLKSPKYNWSNFEWYENDAEEQSEQLAKLTKTVAALQQDKQTSAQNIQADNKKMDQLIQLVTMTNKQVGMLMQAKTPTSTTEEGGKE